MTLQAGLWGLLAGAGLLLGAPIAFFVELHHRLISAVMAFGGGVLIDGLSLGLIEKSFARGGPRLMNPAEQGIT